MLNFGQSAIFSVGLTGIMLLASQGIAAGEPRIWCVFVRTHVCVCVYVNKSLKMILRCLQWPGAGWPEWVFGVIVSLALNLDKCDTNFIS